MEAASTELEKQQGSQVPALANTPAMEIGSEDVALPRLYIGQYMSDHVQEERVKAGAIFTALGKDDPDPQVLWEPGTEEGVRFHVLALRKGKSISADGQLLLYAFDDPDAPADAWVTYNYVIALPRVDQDVPYKWLLTRTGRPAAQQINLVIKKNEARGPAHENAFEVVTSPRENAKGKFFVPRIRPVEAEKEDVELATQFATMLAPDAADIKSDGNEPAI
jgi:hypothetical protein